jgi:hypothetical protein
VAIGYLLLGVVTLAALVGAVAGIAWSPGPQPTGLERAVAATRSLPVYAVSTTVWTSPVPTSGATGGVPSLNSYLTVSDGTARLTVATTPVTVGRPTRTTSSATGDRLVVATTTGRLTSTTVTTTPGAVRRLTAGFDRYLSVAATASNVTWHGATYTFSVPAGEVAQPGLPAFTVAQSRASMAVTVVGGVVGSITVSMAGYGSTQYQTIDVTTPATPGSF